jgi:hypothetical protein
LTPAPPEMLKRKSSGATPMQTTPVGAPAPPPPAEDAAMEGNGEVEGVEGVEEEEEEEDAEEMLVFPDADEEEDEAEDIDVQELVEAEAEEQ